MRKVFNEITGKELHLPSELERIISFSPAVTETLFMLGLGPQVAGVSPFCVRPPEARQKRKVGSYSTARPELLREIDPDVIFTVTGYQRNFALGLSEQFPVYPLELPVSVPGIVDMIVKVGLVTGAYEEARDLERRLFQALESIPSSAGRPSVYVEIDFGGPVTFGAYSYITDGLSLLGGRNIYGGEPVEWLTPSLRDIPRADPDAIFYEAKMFTRFSAEDLDDLISKRGWEGLRACEEGRVFLTPGPDDFMAHHGPSFILQVMPWLSERLQAVAGS